MGQGLREIEEAMSSYAAAFEVGELHRPAEPGPALRSAGRIEKLASALCSMLAARMATGAGDDGDGPLRRVAERHAERELAAAAGTSLEDARRAIEVGKAIAQQPDLAAAARDGELSRTSGRAHLPWSSVDPEAASDLVIKASRMALGESAGRVCSGQGGQAGPGTAAPSGARWRVLCPVVHRPAGHLFIYTPKSPSRTAPW